MGDARDITVEAADGLRLYACERGPRTGGGLTVVCLPGIARSGEDFVELGEALAEDAAQPRRVLALDYRGRGRSGYDSDPARYDVRVEVEDTLQVLAACNVAEAVFVGTSRGGILTMVIAAVRPGLVRGAVLNDIGPVIDTRGLHRIRGYVGKLPQPVTWDEAVDILKGINAAQFPAFTAAQWERLARTTWRERGGRLELGYDPRLTEALSSFDVEGGLPPIWPVFSALGKIPVMTIRGENSDILSAETVTAMEAAHPGLEVVVVPGQGHAPMLDGVLIERIAAFVRTVESTPRPA